jgi:anaphase-promoting complex subunit 11
MKVLIKKWDAVATWRWDLPEDDVCGICQVHFDGTCPTCKYPGDDCRLCKLHCPVLYSIASLLCQGTVRANIRPKCPGNVVTTFTWSVPAWSMLSGKLGVADNLKHCIMEWIKQDSSKGQCPMCRQSESEKLNLNSSANEVFRVRMGPRRQLTPATGGTSACSGDMISCLRGRTTMHAQNPRRTTCCS